MRLSSLHCVIYETFILTLFTFIRCCLFQALPNVRLRLKMGCNLWSPAWKLDTPHILPSQLPNPYFLTCIKDTLLPVLALMDIIPGNIGLPSSVIPFAIRHDVGYCVLVISVFYLIMQCQVITSQCEKSLSLCTRPNIYCHHLTLKNE